MRVTFDGEVIEAITLAPKSVDQVAERYRRLGREVLWLGVVDGVQLPQHDLGPVLVPVDFRGTRAVRDNEGQLLLCRPPVYLCPACGSYLNAVRSADYGDKRDIECEACGDFRISRSARVALARGTPLDRHARAKFAYGVRSLQATGAHRPLVDSYTMKELLAQPLPNGSAQMESMIKWLRAESGEVPGAQIDIERVAVLAPRLGAVGHDGVCFLLRSAENDGLLVLRWVNAEHVVVQLTMKGLSQVPPEEPREPVKQGGGVARPRVVILTALPVETSAVLHHLPDRTSEVHQGTRFYLARFGRWDVVVAEIGAGNSTAAAACAHALHQYSPKVALFVGVAGGLKDVDIGDVVVATKVYRYESGKVTDDGFLVRPDNEKTAHAIEQQARYLIQTHSWRERIPAHTLMRQTQLHVGPIAAGEKVVAAITGDIPELLKRSYGDALAIEMEGHGFLAGTHTFHGCYAGVVRGISDMLAGKSEADAAGSQKIAAVCAAAVAFDILDGLEVD